MHSLIVGQNTKDRPSGSLLDLAQSRFQEAGIATELVDDEPNNAPPFGLVEKLPGADNLGKDATAFDVGDENHCIYLLSRATQESSDTQDEFFEPEDRPDPAALTALIDPLSNSLGREAVTRPRLVPDPQPEYACRFEPLPGLL